ncbi:MAG: NADH-quinone oxidoreductase subunit N [Chloroflexi bacterium]|nr:NADH-quinone oxidoreductase subunit N [Chloroflexota bacterium]
MNNVPYFEVLKLAAPETIVVIAALVVLAVDLLAMRAEPVRYRLAVGAAFTCLGCLAAIFWMFNIDQHGNAMQGMLVVDPLTRLVKQALLVLTVFTAVISLESNFTEHVGEYFALVLLATVGMMFMISSEDILMIFVSLELTSLSLYILAAFAKHSLHSAEAALKYFLFGSMAAAFTLFGLSLLYGLSGATNLSQIAAALKGQALDPLLVAALVMTVIGFGFKVAAVPFHLWAPDAYQGAPTPSAAFIASGSKLASFFLFAKVMMLGFAGAEGSGSWGSPVPGWIPVLAILAAFSMVLGNLAAIVQSNVKRLLAYSAVAHAGYALLGVLAGNQQGVSSLLYYVVTYALTTLGAFGVVAVVENAAGDARMSDFAGLGRRAPLVSFCMMIFMLSLAGIPPLAGFFGKFYVFAAAVGSTTQSLGLLWLITLAIAMSAVSLYYYLQVLKQIYVVEAPVDAQMIRAPLPGQIALSLLALAVVALGCAPNLLIGKLLAAIKIAGL